MSVPLSLEAITAKQPGDRVRDYYGSVWTKLPVGYWQRRGYHAVVSAQMLHSTWGPLKAATAGAR